MGVVVGLGMWRRLLWFRTSASPKGSRMFGHSRGDSTTGMPAMPLCCVPRTSRLSHASAQTHRVRVSAPPVCRLERCHEYSSTADVHTARTSSRSATISVTYLIRGSVTMLLRCTHDPTQAEMQGRHSTTSSSTMTTCPMWSCSHHQPLTSTTAGRGCCPSWSAQTCASRARTMRST
jgi:hypothetical protein